MPTRHLPPLAQRGVSKLIRWQSKISGKLFLRFGRDLCPERWIFVVGCYNSGTTLLAQILAEHPLIGGLPNEGVHLTDSLPDSDQFGWPRMWVKCLEKVRLSPEEPAEKRVERIKKQWSLLYPRDAPNLLEKSTVNVVRMPFLQAHFQPAYFIAVVRDGYAVAEGIRRRSRPGKGSHQLGDKYPMELCAEQWRATNEIIGEDQDKLEHFKLVYYEDLVADPAGVTKDITDFLGLPPLKDEVFQGPWVVHEKNEPILNMNPRSFEALSGEDLDDIDRVAGGWLSHHGYSRPAVHSNE